MPSHPFTRTPSTLAWCLGSDIVEQAYPKHGCPHSAEAPLLHARLPQAWMPSSYHLGSCSPCQVVLFTWEFSLHCLAFRFPFWTFSTTVALRHRWLSCSDAPCSFSNKLYRKERVRAKGCRFGEEGKEEEHPLFSNPHQWALKMNSFPFSHLRKQWLRKIMSLIQGS